VSDPRVRFDGKFTTRARQNSVEVRERHAS
jgi:hypothetical protein